MEKRPLMIAHACNVRNLSQHYFMAAERTRSGRCFFVCHAVDRKRACRPSVYGRKKVACAVAVGVCQFHRFVYVVTMLPFVMLLYLRCSYSKQTTSILVNITEMTGTKLVRCSLPYCSHTSNRPRSHRDTSHALAMLCLIGCVCDVRWCVDHDAHCSYMFKLEQ